MKRFPRRTGRRRVRQVGEDSWGRLQVQSPVDVATMTHDCDGNDMGPVVYRIDDPVITSSYPEPRRMTLEGFSTYGPRLARKGAHLCQHILPDLRVKLAQSLTDARTRVNGVGGHGVPAYSPNSASSSSRGMESPGSFIAASASAASSASSAARRASSTDSGTMAATRSPRIVR